LKDKLYDLTIQGASDLLQSRQVSSVELTKSVLDRIKTTDSQVNALVTVTEELALDQAKHADSSISKGLSGPLTGVPMVLKDNICTQGILTTCSSKMLQNFVPTYNATVASKLYSQGSVLVGKANLDEFAMGSSTENSAFFSTKNPWDSSRVPGGSSGGPAAAVAANECIFSLGSDTGGSIRQPAAFCGVVGLKPTYGRVSRYGLIAFASSLDQIGPITKDVTDAALVLSAISGQDPLDATSLEQRVPNYVNYLNTGVKGLRIGIPEEYFNQDIDPEIKESILKSIDVFENLGAVVEYVSLPLTKYALAVYYILAPSEASANLARYDGVKYGFSSDEADDMWDALEETRQIGFGSEVKRRILLGTYALSSGYYDAYYLKAQKVRTLIRQEFDEIFTKYDLLLSPTSPSVAFDLGEKMDDPVNMYLNDVFTQPANIAGLPAISIPCGFFDGLPIGLQLMANHLGEESLLKAAYAYEQSTDWHTIKPTISI
tara:strand:+ start:22572 stop:24038 length:1467 start_codon:yes stop_codon:yes gene_type:complete